MEQIKNSTVGSRWRNWLIAAVLGIFAVIVFGILWLLFIAPSHPEGFGWFLFSFAAGLSMIVLPCTLPLAFVIVPLSMGKGVTKGLGIALSFGLGVALMLSFYGVAAALLGGVAINTLGAPLESVKNWVYFIAGIFAFLFALGEVGLLKIRMPSYSGAAPAFIQKRQDFLKAFFLGMFLGNIGVGCPHPATPLIFLEIASSGSVSYGWLLFFVHALGRILPLLFLALLGVLGVNGLTWLVARKDKIERATGWAMVFVAGFILTLGLFSHKWWVNSGIHTELEKITQEETILQMVNLNLGTQTVHEHSLETGAGLLGLPLSLGNWVLVLLWAIPIWWWWFRERKRVRGIRGDGKDFERLEEERLLASRKYLFIVLTVLFVLTFTYILPHRFLEERVNHHYGDVADMTMAEHGHAMDEGHAGHEQMGIYREAEAVAYGLLVKLREPRSDIQSGETLTLIFDVIDVASGRPVDDIEIEHEKHLHVIGVRHNVEEFFHLHPVRIAPGVWQTTHTFKKAGHYKIWADVKRAGASYVFGQSMFTVHGRERVPLPITDFPENVIVSDYQVSLGHSEPLVKDRHSTLKFIVRTLYDGGVELEPYLAATMHLAVVKDDLSVYVHTHPADHGHGEMMHDHSEGAFNFIQRVYAHGGEERPHIDSEPVSFNVVFPKGGIYTLFAQFRPRGVKLSEGQSLVATFPVRVLADGSTSVEPDEFGVDRDADQGPIDWRVLLTASLVFIALLSVGVSKFLKVKV